MNKLKILIITYILGVIIGAIFFDVWGANTTFIKTMSIFLWTIIFLIALFYVDKNEIFIKAVLNDIESVSKVSTCKKIEKFDQQS